MGSDGIDGGGTQKLQVWESCRGTGCLDIAVLHCWSERFYNAYLSFPNGRRDVFDDWQAYLRRETRSGAITERKVTVVAYLSIKRGLCPQLAR